MQLFTNGPTCETFITLKKPLAALAVPGLKVARAREAGSGREAREITAVSSLSSCGFPVRKHRKRRERRKKSG